MSKPDARPDAPAPTLLVVDDERRLAELIAAALEDLGYAALVAHDAASALAVMESERIDLVLSDLRMPGMDGHAFLLESRRRWPDVPVVIITAFSDLRDAVGLVKDGAFDYIAKPFEIDDVAATVARALSLTEMSRENDRLRAALDERYAFDRLIGASAAHRAMLAAIAAVCETRATVLLTGESGVGKEEAARAIHFNSPRKRKPFVAVNCAAIPEALLESELFGHVKGAFTGAVAARAGRFEAAQGGTIFLDEIGDMPAPAQVRLLRVLQERSIEPVGGDRARDVDVRVLAATHRDLRREVGEGRFREDLFYRLNVFPIHIPPLRERVEDIALLARRFVARFGGEMGKRVAGFTPAALAALEAHRWPGNVRELQNYVERAMILAQGDRIDVVDLPSELSAPPRREAVAQEAVGGDARVTHDLDGDLERLERAYIEEALRRAGGVQAQAARDLGIAERSLWHRIKRLGVKVRKAGRDDA